MKGARHFRLGRTVVLFALLGVVLALAPVALGNTRIEGGDLPFYARIERGGILHNDEWAFVVFYRPTACVPNDFNLLDFFDIPASFACQPPTTDGFMILASGSEAPYQSKLRGMGAVPVWFVSWPQLKTAIADGVLTMTELEGLSSLTKGAAGFYTETLHPYGVAQNSKLTLVGAGSLEDGRSFFIHATVQETSNMMQVQVAFQ